MHTVLRDVSTGAVETRISNLRNHKARMKKNSQETENKAEEMK